MDYQDSTVGEMFKLCEAMAFTFPLAIARAFDTVADFSAAELELWWRGFFAPVSLIAGMMWPQRPSSAEIESLALEVEQIRSQLRSDTAEQREAEAAAGARFDHFHDQLAELRDQIAAWREELKALAAAKSGIEEIRRLQTELDSLRQQIRHAVAQRETAPLASAAALAEVQKELRALRDRMDSQPTPAPESGPVKSSRVSNGDPARKRPRR